MFVIAGDTFLSRKVVRPKTANLSNMTGQALWNKFANTSNKKRTGPTAKEVKAATVFDLEQQLDTLNMDFVNISTDITDKQVGAGAIVSLYDTWVTLV